jgi:hypothetical protein
MMAVPGVIASMAQGQRIAADSAVRKVMLGLGANKGPWRRHVHENIFVDHLESTDPPPRGL